MWRLSVNLCVVSVFAGRNCHGIAHSTIDYKYRQRNRAVTTTSQTGPIACDPTPMDDVIEHAGEDMSRMQIDTDRNDTHSIESERAPSPMKIDR